MIATDNKRDGGVRTINPATGEVLAEFDYTSSEELAGVLAGAQSALDRFGQTKVEDRIAGITRLGNILRTRRDDLAVQITQEMGKPLKQSLGEIDKCVATCEYYAANLPDMLAPRPINVAPDSASVHLRPLGVVFAILPWNYPWWQVVRAMLPAIGVGNTVVLKHAESVTGCAFTVQDVFREAFDDDVLSTVVLPGSRASETIGDPRVSAVTFTGSEQVGALVAQAAGASLKKCVLELGGSDPFIVLDDADIDAAAEAAVRSRFLNNGQSCIAAKRLIVPRTMKQEFIAAVSATLQTLKVGDPMDPQTDVGPLARFDLLDGLRGQLERAVAERDEIVGEVSRPEGPGAWFGPTLVEVSGRTSPLLREETFGPLGAITFFDDEQEAVAIANDTQYGLSSAVWSSDVDRAQRVAAQINAGSVFINGISASDPRLPVGGVKASGYGRELADYGIAEFANVQAVRVCRAT